MRVQDLHPIVLPALELLEFIEAGLSGQINSRRLHVGDNASLISWADVAETVLGLANAERVAVSFAFKPTVIRGRKRPVMRLSVSLSPLPRCVYGAFTTRTTYNDFPSYTRETMAAWLISTINRQLQGLVIVEREPEAPAA